MVRIEAVTNRTGAILIVKEREKEAFEAKGFTPKETSIWRKTLTMATTQTSSLKPRASGGAIGW